jgi:hypothetical protein
MKLYKLTILIIIQSSMMLAESIIDFKEYEIEIIIFKNLNISSDEIFNNELTTPKESILSFQKPDLKINKKTFDIKFEDGFFSSLLRNTKPFNEDINLSKIEDNKVKAPNPKSWYRKNNNLKTLAKLNNKLLKNGNYEVLDSFSWIQNIEDKNNAIYLHHEELNKKYGFFLKFYKSRFIHTELKAYLGLLGLTEINEAKLYVDKYDKKLLSLKSKDNKISNIKINLNNTNEFVDILKDTKGSTNDYSSVNEIKIFIDEKKRIFNNEIHYFDHPYFGVVIAINEI